MGQFTLSDRIWETSTTTGTGTLTLAGAKPSFQAFSVVGNGNIVPYCISDGTDFEVGIGTYTSSTLSRDTVYSSSNSNNLVNFAAGSKNVILTENARFLTTSIRRNFTLTSSQTVANTVTETSLIGTGSGTNTTTLATNLFAVGTGVYISAYGYFSASNASPTLRIKLKLGSTIILDTTAKTIIQIGAISNGFWKFEGTIIGRTAGGSGTVFGQGIFSYKEPINDTWNQFECTNTATTTIDTTTTQVINLTATWGTASASNTITCSNCLIKENQ